jgi:hypothetical protein
MQTWDAIRARRNVRQNTDQPIAREDLERILEAGGAGTVIAKLAADSYRRPGGRFPSLGGVGQVSDVAAASGVPGLGPAVHQQQRRAVAAGDHVLAQVPGVDVPAGERAGEPFRRCGAPATEPGPSGMADEFMRVSFNRSPVVARYVATQAASVRRCHVSRGKEAASW